MQPHPPQAASKAAPEYVICTSLEDRFYKAGYILRVILEVRVEISNNIGTALDGDPQSGTQRSAETLVLGVPNHDCAPLARDLCGPVGGAIVNRNSAKLAAGYPHTGDALQEFPDGRLFVFGGYDDGE